MKLKNVKGFTLIELILVMVIVSMIIFAGINYTQQRTQQMRIDRTSAQMQQILNAGLTYFVATGNWPQNGIASLQTGGYLPNITLNNPWGQPYKVKPATPPNTSAPPNLYVWTQIPATASEIAAGNAIAASLPLAYTTSSPINPPYNVTACTPGANNVCFVAAQVNIPGQDLNNARAVNFAGLYHHGACVPVPQCPADVTGAYMSPQIMVVPVSVSGTNDFGSPNVYPISSFTAYALGGPGLSPGATPPNCSNHAVSTDTCGSSISNQDKYWRVCLDIVTEKGNVAITNTGAGNTSTFPYQPWGGNVTLLAFTRCAVTNEPSGSSFTVYSQ